MWEKLKQWLGLVKKDERVDVEDTDAYAHFQALSEVLNPPRQVIRGKVDGLPACTYDFWVDVYDGPQGKGYVVNYETTRDGKKIVKRINVGAETHREQDWTEVPVFAPFPVPPVR